MGFIVMFVYMCTMFHSDICIHVYNVSQWCLYTCVQCFIVTFVYMCTMFHSAVCIHVYNVLWSRVLHYLPSLSPSTALLSLPKQLLFYFHVFLKFRFCIWKKACDSCLSEPGLFCLSWWSPVPSIFLQWQFHSSLWLSKTLLCTEYTMYFLSIHLGWF
jgi:hypothetical protein